VAADRIAVLGAGSIGCYVGGAWAAAGLDVTLIGRARFAGAIAEHGLTISDYSGWQETIRPQFVTDPGALSQAKLIIVAVKGGATSEAAQAIASHGASGATVVTLQNGIGNKAILAEALGDRFTLAQGTVPYNVIYLGDGRFHKGVAGKLMAENTPEMRALAERVAASREPLMLSDDMAGVLWGKLLINLNNAVNALSGLTLREELGQRGYRRVVAASQREALRILKRAGIVPARAGPLSPKMIPRIINSPDWLFHNLLARRWKIDEKARSSMSDDLRAGRRTEIDQLNGEVVRLADSLGLDAPINRRIVELVRHAEAGAPALTPEQLERAVLRR
jgi:2-dehydropantoate 2-reductase